VPLGPRMITNRDKLDEFERELARKENLSHKEALAVFDSLHKEAVASGVINSKNIWEGFDAVLRIARAINKVGPG